jgi:serine/threonine-protein kinase
MSSLPISTIGKYEIIEVIGEGGMGTVYKARDPRIGRMVAIKKITAGFDQGSDLLKRFLSEAQAVGKLQHPSIVVIYDLGEDGGNPFLVMEYLTGQPLDKVLAARTELPLIQKLSIIMQVCNALHYAHQRNIVHRDIKPANVILSEDGLAKLVDFGVAHAADNLMTQTGQILGTISYMSPEQLNGQTVDGRSDVFSTGVMLYQLLTYALPFAGQGTAAVISNILHNAPPPLSQYIRDYPAELDEIVERALEKNRERRYATAEDFAFDLSRVQEVLKRDAVNHYVGQARACIAKSELPPAREMLSRALKIDTQHSVAKQLMYEVQRLAEREQTAQRIQQLRTQAEEAWAQKRHSEALELIDQALELDQTDTELLSLRDHIQQAESRQKQVLKLLRLAENAQQAGELSMAMGAVQDAMQLDPDDTQVKTLHASLVQQISDHEKQKQLRELMNSVHREISAKQFTAAYELLQQAEAIDPGNREIQSLQNLVTSVRQQDFRRNEIQSLRAEVESLLTAGDLTGACAKADLAASRFPGEPALIQLKAAAENQRENAERSRFIEAQISEVNQLLNLGNPDAALKVIQRACQRFTDDSRLQATMESVRERVQQQKTERLKKSCMQKAKEEMQRGEYDAASLTLESAQEQLRGDSDVNALLQQVRSKMTQATKDKRIETACTQGQQLLQDGEFDRAIILLERAASEFSDPRLENLLQQAKAKAGEFNGAANSAAQQAQRMLQEGKIEETLTFLLAQPGSYGRVEAFAETCELARQQHERTVTSVQRKSPAPVVANAEAGTQAPESAIPMIPPIGIEPTVHPVQESAVAGSAVNAVAPVTEAVSPMAEAVSPEVHEPPAAAKAALPSTEGPRASQAEAVPAKARVQSNPVLRYGVIAGALVVIALIAASTLHHRSASSAVSASPAVSMPSPVSASAPVPVSDAYVEVLAQPWATVKSLTSAQGKVIAVDELTPVRVKVPAGEYTITLAGPNSQEHTEQLSVAPGKPAQYSYVFEAVDAAKIVSAY